MADVKFAVEVKNLPKRDSFEAYIVARVCENELWYYGTYAEASRAEYVANEIGNGIVLQTIEA